MAQVTLAGQSARTYPPTMNPPRRTLMLAPPRIVSTSSGIAPASHRREQPTYPTRHCSPRHHPSIPLTTAHWIPAPSSCKTRPPATNLPSVPSASYSTTHPLPPPGTALVFSCQAISCQCEYHRHPPNPADGAAPWNRRGVTSRSSALWWTPR